MGTSRRSLQEAEFWSVIAPFVTVSPARALFFVAFVAQEPGQEASSYILCCRIQPSAGYKSGHAYPEVGLSAFQTVLASSRVN